MRRSLALAVMLALGAVTSCNGDAADTATTSQAPSTTSAPTPTDETTPTSAASNTVPEVPQPAGTPGVGDPYFPQLGNGGYDVGHYSIDITIDPSTAELEATTSIEAVATETLATFNLDLVGLEVEEVLVDGASATYLREDGELRISPDRGIVAGEPFVVVVSYRGRPEPVTLASVGVQIGWRHTDEGIYVAAEPDAARTWFPSNDHPSDKATFDFRITVPKPLIGAANGELVDVADNGDTRTYAWHLESSMATYLATVVVGEYDRVERATPEGIVLRDYIPTSFDGELPGAFEITAEALDLLVEWFGPYPFDRYGHIVVSDLGGALETQTLSLMGDRALFDEVTVHELAHQWFGDSVSPATWQDIWLNEGFATFAEFLWLEHRRGTDSMGRDIEERHERLSSLGHSPIADPQVSQLFGPAVYWRGGMTLHALRVELANDELMKEILQTYFERHRDGNATTQDFIDVAEELSATDLTDLWDRWLYTSQLPPLP